jgi:hypothetical protein
VHSGFLDISQGSHVHAVISLSEWSAIENVSDAYARDKKYGGKPIPSFCRHKGKELTNATAQRKLETLLAGRLKIMISDYSTLGDTEKIIEQNAGQQQPAPYWQNLSYILPLDIRDAQPKPTHFGVIWQPFVRLSLYVHRT